MNLVLRWMEHEGISKADYVDVPLELVNEFFKANPGLPNPELLIIDFYDDYFHSAAVVDGFVHCPWFNQVLPVTMFARFYFPGQKYEVKKWE